MFIETTRHRQAEARMRQAIASKFLAAHQRPRELAVHICNEDTGDLRGSIRTEGPMILPDSILCAIAAGGTMGPVRGHIIDYALEHHIFNPYLSPVRAAIVAQFKAIS